MPASRSKVAAPVVHDVTLEGLIDADPNSITAGESYEACRYVAADLSGRDLSGTMFTECEFVGVEAHEAQLGSVRFVEARIERVNAPVLKAARSTWRDVLVADSRLGAAEMYDAELQSVRFSGCKLSFVNLRAASLRNVVFDHCDIDELDLTGAQAERIAFSDCRLRAIALDRAGLRDVDLRGLDLSSISGIESMHGTVMTTGQIIDLAPLFAGHFGIRILD